MISFIQYRFRYTMRNEPNKYEKQGKIGSIFQEGGGIEID